MEQQIASASVLGCQIQRLGWITSFQGDPFNNSKVELEFKKKD